MEKQLFDIIEAHAEANERAADGGYFGAVIRELRVSDEPEKKLAADLLKRIYIAWSIHSDPVLAE